MKSTEDIRKKVERAVQRRWWMDGAPGLLEQLGGHERLHPQLLGEALLFIERYVRAVPDLLDTLEKAAEEAELRTDLDLLLEAAVGYWDLDDDLLPDHLGLIGLADDAYLSLRLIECVTEKTRARTDRPAFGFDLAQANLAMASLLGPELTERLDAMVDSTIGRADLRSALDVVSAWDRELAPVDAPTLPEADIDEPVVAAAARLQPAGDREDVYSTRQIVWGNVSVLSLGLGVLLFTGWQLYFAYPADTEVTILGWGGIHVSWLDRVRTFILGSLGMSALFAVGNARNLIAHFYWPFEHLQGKEVKRFLGSRGTALFSVVVLVLFGYICLANVSVPVSLRDAPQEELIARLAGQGDAFFFAVGAEKRAGREQGRGVRLRGGEPAVLRLGLRGLGADAVLILRDKYNFMTMDAVRVQRAGWKVQVSPLDLEFPPPASLDDKERKKYQALEDLPASGGVVASSRWRLEVRTPARWNRGVFQRVVDLQGRKWGALGTNRLQLFPSLGTACPPSPLADRPAINAYWEEQCRERELLSTWAGLGHSVEGEETTVTLSLPFHRVEVHFGTGLIRDPDDPSRPLSTTREAIRTVAYRQQTDQVPGDSPTAQVGNQRVSG